MYLINIWNRAQLTYFDPKLKNNPLVVKSLDTK